MNFAWKEGNAGGYRRRRSLDPLWTDSETADARDMRAFCVTLPNVYVRINHLYQSSVTSRLRNIVNPLRNYLGDLVPEDLSNQVIIIPLVEQSTHKKNK